MLIAETQRFSSSSHAPRGLAKQFSCFVCSSCGRTFTPTSALTRHFDRSALPQERAPSCFWMMAVAQSHDCCRGQRLPIALRVCRPGRRVPVHEMITMSGCKPQYMANDSWTMARCANDGNGAMVSRFAAHVDDWTYGGLMAATPLKTHVPQWLREIHTLLHDAKEERLNELLALQITGLPRRSSPRQWCGRPGSSENRGRRSCARSGRCAWRQPWAA